MSYTRYAEPYPESRGDRFGATEGRAHAHRGQDTAPGGLPALAIARGRIVRKIYNTALGNVTVLQHDDGKFSGYAHTKTASEYALGTVIELLESIGCQIGATGTAQDGRHLHYTLGNDIEGVISGHVEDPLAWIGAHSAPESSTGGGDLYTATETDGIPGIVFYTLLQRWAADWGYTGPEDGKPGPNTWAAVQRALRPYGYTGPDDGQPGPNTYAALQRLAAQNGYTGPADGQPGPNTWRAVARFLNRIY